jgi:hypothetical protein
MRFNRVLLCGGVFNICVAAPLAVPGLIQTYYSFLWRVNQAISLGGNEPLAPSEPLNSLMVNTVGLVLVLIGLLVIYASFDPPRRAFIPLANAIARFGFAGLVLYYTITFNIAHILLFIAAIDVFIGVVFLLYLKALQWD